MEQAFFMGVFIQSASIPARRYQPTAARRREVFAAVSDHTEKRIVRVNNAVELARNDAGDRRFSGKLAGSSLACVSNASSIR